MSSYNPVIYNELVRIGSVMMDMRKELEFEIDEKHVEALEREFTRIQKDLTAIWSDKPWGLAYFLEFHLQEAQRLNSQITEEEKRAGENSPTIDDEFFRAHELTVISYGLDGTIELLERLINGGDIDIN
jgi:uncharacterized protein YbaP (TraB family)